MYGAELCCREPRRSARSCPPKQLAEGFMWLWLSNLEKGSRCRLSFDLKRARCDDCG